MKSFALLITVLCVKFTLVSFVSVSGVSDFTPSQLYLLENTSVTVPCLSDTNPVEERSWYYGDKHHIKGARNTFLHHGIYHTFINLNRSDMGFGSTYYWCYVSYSSGQSWKGISIFTTFPPDNVRIERQTVNGTDQLSCTAQSYPKADVIWIKDGSVIGQQDIHYNLSKIDSSTGSYHQKLVLILKNSNHSGELICRASNGLGYAEAKIEMNGGQLAADKPTDSQPAAILSATPKEVNVIENSTVVLECVVGGNPAPRVWWQMVDSLNNNSVIKEGKVFTIASAKRSDAKHNYTCLADNGVGQVASQKVKLRVSFPPENIRMWREDVINDDGDHAIKVCCSADEYPHRMRYFNSGEDAYSWYFEKQNWEFWSYHGTHQRIDEFNITATIRIDAKRDEHYGTYICRIQNDLGSVSDTITITKS